MSDTTDHTGVEDLIRYDVLAQEALRGVVRKVLAEVGAVGELPGEHHFYITFDTTAPGVQLSNRMRERYPEEMTIVVQHQFWDLKAGETSFSIGLSFNDVPETLVIPYLAIRGFFDPAVQFGLQFDAGEQQSAEISALPAPQDTAENAEASGDAPEVSGGGEDGSAEVVSLDAFRKR